MEQKLYDAASKLPETNLNFNEIGGSARLEHGAQKKGTAFGGAKRLLAAAACLVVLICLGSGTYAYAAEVKEYNAAVRFFDENDLSTEGLTRSEIKEVYRDITTESFSYEKTAQVILSSDRVDGYEIRQKVLTGEDLEAIWNGQYSGIRYQVLTVDPDKYYLEKYEGETLVWSVDCSQFSYPSYKPVSDGVLVYNYNRFNGQALLVKLDNDGNLLWQTQPDNGFNREQFVTVLENDDGSYAVIGKAHTKDYGAYLCLSQYTPDGKRTLYKTSEASGYVIDATRLGDGYLVLLGSGQIVKMDHDGNLTDSFSYSSDEAVYHLQSMIEFNGKIYLSTYATPKLAEDEPTYGSRTEIARILDYAFSKKGIDIPSEELTPVVRNNYTAVLLVCDPDSGIPKEFYSVAGSLGGALTASEDRLLWNVESITTTFFSPATSSFTIGGTCCVFRYTFDDSGILVSQEKTDETTDYRR